MSISIEGNLERAHHAVVQHDSYGCESGCCGHRAILRDVEENDLATEFHFSHPFNQNHEEFARELVADSYPDFKNIHVEFDLCEIVDD